MENKEKNFVSAVIYVHNHENLLLHFLEKVNRVLAQNFECYEIICVDDHSTDDSVRVIKDFAQNVEGASVTILHMSYYQGVELAMNAGMDLAIGDFVFEFDKADEEFSDELPIKVYEMALKGFDIVSAAPGRAERWSSRLFYWIYNRAAAGRGILRSETFRILSRRAINRVHAMCQSIPYRKAVYASCGLPTQTIVYEQQPFKGSFSREERENRRDMAFNSLILFTNLGCRLSGALAGLMMFLVILIGLYTVVIFVGAKPVEGWTTTMLFLSLAFFGVFAIFSIMMKYLTILIDLVFTKQRYVVEGIEKIK